jgi:hypothetical protein
MQADDAVEFTTVIESNLGTEAADRYRAVASTFLGSYDLLHQRYQYVAL